MKKLDILYEDKDLLCVNKPSGLLTVSAGYEKENTLYHLVYEYLHKKNQKVFIIHRLDKDTCGLVLFAKNIKVQKLMQNNWDDVKRFYIACVHGKMPKTKDTVVLNLMETRTYLTYVSKNIKEGKKAITSYEVIKENKMYSLLKIDIKTGRKNQIRVTMNYLNHPIVGDKKYSSIKDRHKNLALCANGLIFSHPTLHKEITIKLKTPKFIDELL